MKFVIQKFVIQKKHLYNADNSAKLTRVKDSRKDFGLKTWIILMTLVSGGAVFGWTYLYGLCTGAPQRAQNFAFPAFLCPHCSQNIRTPHFAFNYSISIAQTKS